MYVYICFHVRGSKGVRMSIALYAHEYVYVHIRMYMYVNKYIHTYVHK
jgi:hypothetical protein